MVESPQAHSGDPPRPASPPSRSPQAHGGDPPRPASPPSRSPRRQPDRPGEDDPGRGRRLGVDVGTVRIGVAVSDPDGILATPVETVRRDRSGKHLRRLAALVAEFEAVEVIVGLPRTLADHVGSSALDSIQLASELAEVLARRVPPTPVRLADERLTTVAAQRSLRDAGIRAKQQRSVIDQAAAVGILQGWLEQRRAVVAAPAEQASDV